MNESPTKQTKTWPSKILSKTCYIRIETLERTHAKSPFSTKIAIRRNFAIESVDPHLSPYVVERFWFCQSRNWFPLDQISSSRRRPPPSLANQIGGKSFLLTGLLAAAAELADVRFRDSTMVVVNRLGGSRVQSIFRLDLTPHLANWNENTVGKVLCGSCWIFAFLIRRCDYYAELP